MYQTPNKPATYPDRVERGVSVSQSPRSEAMSVSNILSLFLLVMMEMFVRWLSKKDPSFLASPRPVFGSYNPIPERLFSVGLGKYEVSYPSKEFM